MGSPKVIPTRIIFGTTVPEGWILSVLNMAIGITGAPDSMASLAIPVRPLYKRPSGERVPSG